MFRFSQGCNLVLFWWGLWYRSLVGRCSSFRIVGNPGPRYEPGISWIRISNPFQNSLSAPSIDSSVNWDTLHTQTHLKHLSPWRLILQVSPLFRAARGIVYTFLKLFAEINLSQKYCLLWAVRSLMLSETSVSVFQVMPCGYVPSYIDEFLDVFSKLLKVINSFVLSVRLFVCLSPWNNSTPLEGFSSYLLFQRGLG